MSNEKVKVLVLNPLSTNVGKAVKIVNMQNKKAGPFDFSIFLGDIFHNSKEDLSLLKPDIPIYFCEGENKMDIPMDKLDSNFQFLGSLGIFKLLNGLKIGFVSGILEDVTSEDIQNKFIKNEDVDILISYHWPEAIAKEEKVLLAGNEKLDCLINTVKPRYWISAGGTNKGRFFEREAYKIENKITRFISLATMNEGRWWYAFQINIDADDDDTDSIKLGSKPIVKIHQLPKRTLEDVTDSDIPNKQIKLKATEVTPSTCFLCLANPTFGLHMVVSVANLSYLTISKGPLTLKKPLGFSGHGMIVPVEHYPTLRAYVHDKNPEGKVEVSDIYLEIVKFQQSITTMFKSLGDFTVVFWEISRMRSVHYHLQFVPVHINTVPYFEKTLKGQIEYDKRLYPDRLIYKKIEEKDDMTELYKTVNDEDYVLFTLYEKFGVTKYLIKLGNDNDKYFDPQFPRKVLAVLLNLKNRIRWDKCSETVEDETFQKEKFQEAYRPFDIMTHAT